MPNDGGTDLGTDVAINGLYLTLLPNAPLDLYEGDLVLKWDQNEVQAPGSVRLVWEPFPRLTFKFEVPLEEAFGGALPAGNLPSDVEVRLADHLGKGDGIVLGSITTAGSNAYRQSILGGFPGDFVRGDPAPTESVIFHLCNFPDYLGTSITSADASWGGRLAVEAEGWRVELDAVSHRSELWSDLASRGGYGITHVGRVTRTNERAIPFSDIEMLRTTLFRWLTLIRGERTEPFLLAGVQQGAAVWELWAAPEVAPWITWRSWLPKALVAPIPGTPPVDLSPIFGSLLRVRTEPELERVIGRAIDWYTQCIEPTYSATTVVLAQAGLELMSWLRLVEEVGLTEEAFVRLHAADALRIALEHAQIPASVPEAAVDLFEAARAQGSVRQLDGPGVVVELRNGTIHPRARRRLADPFVEVQGSLLATRYLELLLLHRLGYVGMTLNRVELASGATQARPVSVPWAQPSGRPVPGAENS